MILVGWDRRMHPGPETVDWSILGTTWLLALVALSHRAWVWGSGAAAVFAVHAYFVLHGPA